MIKYVSNRVGGDGGTKQKYFVTDLVVVTDGITKCKITVTSLRSLAVQKTGECQQGEEHYYKKEARYTVSF